MEQVYIDLIFLKLNAFIEDDGYAHFSLDNLSIKGLNDNKLSLILKTLEQQGKIVNCTINGFYSRYKVNYPVKCPDFINNDNLTFGNKVFIYKCMTLLDNPTEYRSARKVALAFGKTDYKHESLMFTQIKQALGMSVFEYISNIKYIKLKISNTKYPLIKKENGYQIDSESEARIRNNKETYAQRKERLIEEGTVGEYLHRKIVTRSGNNPERFKENTITAEELDEIYNKQDGKDYYTGLPFESKLEISSDRIDSSKPYTKDNIVLTTIKINQMKNDLNIEKFIDICKLISKHFQNIEN